MSPLNPKGDHHAWQQVGDSHSLAIPPHHVLAQVYFSDTEPPSRPEPTEFTD
jgi:hypothetical protein